MKPTHRPAAALSNLVILLLVCLFPASGLLAMGAEASPARPGDAVVVAAHPLASNAGLDVLRKGGNAADAAIAALMVLNVVEPHASGLGGGGFAVIQDPHSGLAVLDFREVAPAGIDPAAYFDPADSLQAAQQHGGTTIGVPGSPAGLAMLHERYGSLPLSELLQPAIRLARDGYPVSATLSTLIAERVDLFLSDSSWSELFLVDGFPPMEGEILHNPGLAALLERLATGGLAAFYPLLATELSSTIIAAGGWVEPRDLLEYEALWRDPLVHDWKGRRLVGPPPPATGALAVMQCLGILEELDLEAMPEAQRMHVMAEAMKQAMRDKGKRAGDPAFSATPTDSLLDRDYARRVLAQIHPDAIHHSWPPLGSRPVWQDEHDPPRDHGNTTHLSVWDAQGQVISLTQSINHFFGAGVQHEGLLLNNQLSDFTFIEGSLNDPQAGKRPRSSMAPMILLQEDEAVLCLGTPGGPRIVSAMIEILVSHIDLGMPIQQAIEAPRFHPLGSTLVLEPRFAPETMSALEDIGYRPYPLKAFDTYFGGAHGIQRRHGPAVFRGGGGVKPPPFIELMGGADPRRDGTVARQEAE